MASLNASLPADAAQHRPFVLKHRLWLILSLLIVYVVWGTTYLVIRFALEGFTPYWMMALRFLVAGGILMLVLRLRGAALPTPRQWRNAAVVGALLLGGGMGSVALAEESISSGLAATLVATSPLWALLFARLWGRVPHRGEIIGVVVGLVGVVVLSLEGNLQANPGGIVLVLFASASWAFGSTLIRRLDMPEGAMGSAAEMVAGGLVLCGMALLRGEPFPSNPTPGSVLALVYLITLGSLAAMLAYGYLLRHVSPTLALSYSFVNPAIALLLGTVIGGEVLTGSALVALPIILVALAFVFQSHRQDTSSEAAS